MEIKKFEKLALPFIIIVCFVVLVGNFVGVECETGYERINKKCEKIVDELDKTYNEETVYNYKTEDFYNYDVEGENLETGEYFYGTVNINSDGGEGYIYGENDEEIYVDVSWIDYGEIEAIDDDGNPYYLTTK